MESGEQCVGTSLIKLMLTLFADSWATTVQTSYAMSNKLCLEYLSISFYTLQ